MVRKGPEGRRKKRHLVASAFRRKRRDVRFTSAVILVGASALLVGVARGPWARQQPPVAAADLVLTNGRIVTVDDSMPQAEAVAVRGDRIVALGGRCRAPALRRYGDARDRSARAARHPGLLREPRPFRRHRRGAAPVEPDGGDQLVADRGACRGPPRGAPARASGLSDEGGTRRSGQLRPILRWKGFPPMRHSTRCRPRTPCFSPTRAVTRSSSMPRRCRSQESRVRLRPPRVEKSSRTVAVTRSGFCARRPKISSASVRSTPGVTARHWSWRPPRRCRKGSRRSSTRDPPSPPST